MQTDTIAAIATALSDSGIGIIRISGDNAISVADSVFLNKYGKRNLLHAQSHTVHYGFIVDFMPDKSNFLTDANSSFEILDQNRVLNSRKDLVQDDALDPNQAMNPETLVQDEAGWKDYIIDEVMVSVMKAPNSYTREDTVEINCHGGVFVMQKILETVLRVGARLAEPGEFTKRAFLNGRIDLSKAEAVMDLIRSRNELALKSSVSQLKGDLSDKIRKFRAELIYEIAYIESALDDPEHISLDGYPDRLNQKVNNLIFELQNLIETADNGRLIKEGISTVILGKPNAGKSSLLNILVGRERAIVTDVAGTTRDVLEEHINLNGVSLNVIDTAGIRDTKDTVEKIGVDMAKKYAKEADLIVYVVDSSVELDESDCEIISLINGKNTIILLNKSDKETVVNFSDIASLLKSGLSSGESLSFSESEESVSLISLENEEMIDEKLSSVSEIFFNDNKLKGKIKLIRTSTKNITDSAGIREFEETVEKMFFSGQLKNNHELVITNLRHKEALQNSLSSLKIVKRSIEDGMEEDFFSIDLMSAYSELGKIIGEEVEDDLVEEIFSKFCMGK